MQASTMVQPDEAAQTLESVRAARDAADRRLEANWFPLVVFGLLLFASSWLFDVWDGAAVAVFWLAAAPFAIVAIKRDQRMRLRASGAIRDERWYALVAGSFIAACVVFGAVGGAIGEATVINYGPLLGIAGAYAFLAWRDRSPGYAAWAVGLVVFMFAAFLLLEMVEPARILAIAIGGNLVIEGVRERNKGHV